MFVRRLVSGVRSSCEASWTSWRWRCAASSSDASIALKVVASRLSSSLPGDVDPLGEVARRAHVLGGLAEPAQRLERGARDEEARGRRDRDPAEGDEEEPELDPRERVVGGVDRGRDLDREARPAGTATV